MCRMMAGSCVFSTEAVACRTLELAGHLLPLTFQVLAWSESSQGKGGTVALLLVCFSVTLVVLELAQNQAPTQGS